MTPEIPDLDEGRSTTPALPTPPTGQRRSPDASAQTSTAAASIPVAREPAIMAHYIIGPASGPFPTRPPANRPPRRVGPPPPFMRTLPVPPPVVIDIDSSATEKDAPPDPKNDLWLSTADGQYESPMVAVRVGQLPELRTFYAHRDILTRSKWFEKALCGGFKESQQQAIDLPEEDPAIFHFVISFLYEKRYAPLRPAADVLDTPVDKGKAKEENPPANAQDDTDNSSISSNSSVSTLDRTNVDRDRSRVNRKDRGEHRVDCRCYRCTNRSQQNRPCRYCGALPVDDPRAAVNGQSRHTRNVRNRPAWLHEQLAETVKNPTVRISTDDMRTWLIAYELNLDVYICAVRYLMDGLQTAVIRSTVDMLETAGSDAAQLKVLELCAKLHASVPETDPLLTMVLARVGFLQALLWQKAPVETSEFLVGHPELAAVILRETSRRHDNEDQYRILPAMETSSLHRGTMLRYAGRPPTGFLA